MGYSSKSGGRPFEYASKSAHSHIINDSSVVEFLKSCKRPVDSKELNISDISSSDWEPSDENNPIQHVIAIDGGAQEISHEKRYPSSSITFFQFGANTFRLKDLQEMSETPFISPDDMEKLSKIQRFKLTLPTRNIVIDGEGSLTGSVRRSVYNFFVSQGEEGGFAKTLKWLLYEEFLDTPNKEWVFANCPHCEKSELSIKRESFGNNYSAPCPACAKEIFITDSLRLHERVDDELGAGSIIAYLATTIEQILMAHFIRVILDHMPDLLKRVLFIKDGPLAFFGQTAKLHQPMRSLVKYLHRNHAIYMVGVEKSGRFVEHALEIREKLPEGYYLLLSNDYIYRNVIPGDPTKTEPYGRSTYFGNKAIFRSRKGDCYVLTVPNLEPVSAPKKQDLVNFDVVLSCVEELRCDLYEASLVPVALINKLVSLANVPSSAILKQFTRETVRGS